MKRVKRAERIVKNKEDFVVGGYENEITDGDRETMPSMDELVDEIYWEVIGTAEWEKLQNKDLKFLTTKALKEMIRESIEFE